MLEGIMAAILRARIVLRTEFAALHRRFLAIVRASPISIGYLLVTPTPSQCRVAPVRFLNGSAYPERGTKEKVRSSVPHDREAVAVTAEDIDAVDAVLIDSG